MNLELCTDCVEGAEIALKFGFKRIELCSALSEGGLTPSYGLMKSCAKSAGTVEVHSMIRVRGGGFTCVDSEFRVMSEDVEQAARAGARGAVFGILDEDGRISEKNVDLLRKAHGLGMQATFHRAFDQLTDPMHGIQTLIDMGFDRLLTSGLKEKAIEGIELLRAMQKTFGKSIEIMAGSGVNSDNAHALAQAGIDNLHFTARKMSNEDVVDGMGVHMITDEQKIRSILEALK